MTGLNKFYTIKIDGDFMFVKSILKGFNSKTVHGVLLDDGSVYFFNMYSLVEFNGHKFRIGDSAENAMLENAFLTLQSLDSL